MLFGGPAAARWPGGLAAARPWQRHASLDTRLSLITIVTIPHAIVTIPPPFDLLVKPEVTGESTQRHALAGVNTKACISGSQHKGMH